MWSDTVQKALGRGPQERVTKLTREKGQLIRDLNLDIRRINSSWGVNVGYIDHISVNQFSSLVDPMSEAVPLSWQHRRIDWVGDDWEISQNRCFEAQIRLCWTCLDMQQFLRIGSGAPILDQMMSKDMLTQVCFRIPRPNQWTLASRSVRLPTGAFMRLHAPVRGLPTKLYLNFFQTVT